MSNYNNLKTTIDANIKQNGNQEITGPILNSVLNQMVNILGTGYQFAGIATLDPATDPGTPDAKVFYIANGKGTYTNFGGIEVTEDEVVVLYWDTAWHKVSTGIASQAKLSELKEKVDALALGAFYGYFPDSASLPTDVTTSGYAYVGLDNPYKIWNFIGESWSDSGTSIDINDADEEDITRNADGKLQFKDRSYGDGMGYVILRKDKSFAEQVSIANTIYEVRYDFDLEGKTIEIPVSSVLLFKGGHLSNGKLAGQLTSLLGQFETLTDVLSNIVLDGSFANREESFSWWGGVPNSQELAVKQKNTEILSYMLKNKLNIKFVGEYYLLSDVIFSLDYVLRIYGNANVHNLHFNFANNGGFAAENISFVDDLRENEENSRFIYSSELLDITIPTIELYNCTFNYKRVVSLYFQDINSDETHYGIDNLVVKECRFLNGASLRLLDCPIWSPALIQDNRFEEADITPIYFAWQHSQKVYPTEVGTYMYVEEGIRNTPKITISNNYFKGKIVSIDSYYCSALVVNNVVEFCGNYIEDFINYTDGVTNNNATCYDTYLSCAEVYYHDNIIKNVIAFTRNGGTRPPCEIFKSKINPLKILGVPMIREYHNNNVCCDKERLNGIVHDELSIDFLLNTDRCQMMRYTNNTFELKGISLQGKDSGYGSSDVFVFSNNSVFADYTGKYFYIINTEIKKASIYIENNTFVLNQYRAVHIVDSATSLDTFGFDDIVVRGNTCVNCSVIVFAYKANNYIVKDNLGSDIRLTNSNVYLNSLSGMALPYDASLIDVDYVMNNALSSKSFYIHVSEKTKGKITLIKNYFSPYHDRILVDLHYANLTRFNILETYSVSNVNKAVCVNFSISSDGLVVKKNNEVQTLSGDTTIYEEDSLTIRISNNVSSQVATIEIGNVSQYESKNNRFDPIKIILSAL